VRVGSAAWYYPRGGWVDPRSLARSFLSRAAARVELRPRVEVAKLRRLSGGGWMLLDRQGAAIAESVVVVLANAGGALELLGGPAWPIEVNRGQLTSWVVGPEEQGAIPRLPVAGAGYVLPAIDGTVWFGASSQRGDEDPSLRRADQEENLARLASLLGPLPPIEAGRLGGRTGFRWVSADRLPVIGAVPALASERGARRDQPRFVPREAGLFVFTALGSRGIAASILGAQILASAITGAPSPVEADLLDAVDPARFQVRDFRRGAALEVRGEAAQPPVGPMAGSAGA
jgi:tRNA 5-methylaminomethyl-2-thiouridine biosynthesis bifunctional protein